MKSDAAGFLIGEPSVERSVTGNLDVSKDIREIKVMLEAIKKEGLRSNVAQDKVSKQKKKDSDAEVRNNKTSLSLDRSKKETHERKKRDSLGRFVGKKKDKDKKIERTESGLLGRVSSNLYSSKIAEGLDPAVTAMKEIINPIKSGYDTLSQKKDEPQVKWLRKISSGIMSLVGGTKETNKKIEDGLETVAISSGGGSGGDRTKRNVGRGIIPLLAAVVKKVPLIATALSMVSSLLGVSDTENSNLSRREKDTKNGSAIGGNAVMLAGMFTGVKAGAAIGAFAGPIGAAIGAAVLGAAGAFFGKDAGEIVGAKVGEWTNDLRKYDIPSRITSIFTSLGKSAFGGATSFIKKATGIDLSPSKKPFDMISAAKTFRGGGKIKGLSDTQTRALAADTQRTESRGDKFAENRFGYAGKYQFGASALADVGLVDRERLKAAKASGYKGGQKKFLSNPDNWLIEGGKESFLKNSELQDRAFVKLANQNIEGGMRTKGLGRNSKPESIAAYAKTAHLLGVGGANDLFKSGHDGADANGTRGSKYAADGAKAIRVLAPALVGVSKLSNVSSNHSKSVVDMAKNAPSAMSIPEMINSDSLMSSPKKSDDIKVVINDRSVDQGVGDRRINMLSNGGLSAL